MNRTVLAIGIVIAAALVVVLFVGLGKDPSKIESPLIDKPAPEFSLRQVGTNNTIDLAQYRGKPLVINFWATWCVPCWDEHPSLVASARQLQPDVQFLGVVFQDNEDKILGFLRQRGTAYPTVVDEKGKTAIAYGIGGVPETYFLDAKGTIRAKYIGPMNGDIIQENLQKVLRQ